MTGWLRCLSFKWIYWYRKHLIIWPLLVFGTIILAFPNLLFIDNSFNLVKPLYCIQCEARRLLKYITYNQYECRNKLFEPKHLNQSWWTVCIDSIDFSLNSGIEYTVGVTDYKFEKLLAQNFSFLIFAMTPKIKHIATEGSITYLPYVVSPNDPSDVMRNSFNQRTINDIMHQFGHDHINILRILSSEATYHNYEILEFLVKDNLLFDINELHIVMGFDKLDEDTIYRWYRVLQDLFYNQDMRLYHTVANDPLCLEVTILESCIYGLSFIRSLGSKSFVLHPPAHDGMKDLEHDRFVDYTSVYESCSNSMCEHLLQDTSDIIFEPWLRPAILFVHSQLVDHIISSAAVKQTYRPILFRHDQLNEADCVLYSYKTWKWIASNWTKVRDAMKNLPENAILSIDTINADHYVPTLLMNHNLLKNITWIRMNILLTPTVAGKQSAIYRLWYSELHRLNANGFTLVKSQLSELKKSFNIRLLYRNIHKSST